MVEITFDGQLCERVIARKLADNNIIADTNNWTSDHKILITTNARSLSVQRYRLDAENNILLTVEHIVIGYDKVLQLTVTYKTTVS